MANDDRELDEAFVMAVLRKTAPNTTWRLVVMDGVECVFAPLDELVADIGEQVNRVRRERGEDV